MTKQAVDYATAALSTCSVRFSVVYSVHRSLDPLGQIHFILYHTYLHRIITKSRFPLRVIL